MQLKEIASAVVLTSSVWGIVVNAVIALNWITGKINTVTSLINGVFGTNIGAIPEIQLPTSGIAAGTSTPKGLAFTTGLTSSLAQTIISQLSGAGAVGGAIQAAGGITETTVVLEIDKRELGRVTYQAVKNQDQHIGVTLEG